MHTLTPPELPRNGMHAQMHNKQPVVLVVDDEKVIADTLAAIFTQHGFSSVRAYDAASALAVARSTSPDLLLSDVVMPGMTGIDLAIEITSIIPKCRILLFSGQAATVSLLAEAQTAGHNFSLLQKPIHPTDLLARVSELLH